MYNSAGAKIEAIFALNQVADIIYDGTDFVILNLPQSATTSPALTGIPTAPTPTTGDNGTSIATTAFVNNSCIGLGQTWNNLTASRVAGTTYYNSTGRPIIVSLAILCTSYSTFVVNGVTVAEGGGNASIRGMMAGVVPSGGSYSVTTNGLTIDSWSELR